MTVLRKTLLSACVLAMFLGAAPVVRGDWDPCDGHKMHYPQLPDETGWDVMATYPVILADDWRCSETGWVKDIHFWGSWKNGVEGQIRSFFLSIHDDIPAGPDSPYSRPGQTLWEGEIYDFLSVPIDPPSMQGWFDPSTGEVIYDDHSAYFQYNIELPENDWVWQEKGKIYWLNISANVEQGPTTEVWGWKSTQDHFWDDAVWAYAGELQWADIHEPEPMDVNNFYIEIDEYGNYVRGGGDGYVGSVVPPGSDPPWYYYEHTNWWNQWYYDGEFDPNRDKIVRITFNAYVLQAGLPAELTVAVNWSSDLYPSGSTEPPVPYIDPADEDMFIRRQILLNTDIVEGDYDLEYVIRDYNPEWVSIDVNGFNFGIQGELWHACMQSLDLAFVITGDNRDWGDAPDYTPVAAGYPTKSSNNGANHLFGGPWLGDAADGPDYEADGQPDPAALGDDQDTVYPPPNDDEDGVSIPVLVPGQTDNITFEVNGGGGHVNIWIDWNSDMDWDDAGEKVEDSWYGDGVHTLAVTPPAASVVGQTFLRARISNDGSLPPGGAATDGEVEDHAVWIEESPPELDFGDAPDLPYPTLRGRDGARHIITPGPHFCAAAGGGIPDPEPDGQPDAQALGDDNDGNDDEEGVTFPTLVQWVPDNIVVNVCDNGGGGGGVVQIWIDFNGNGVWEPGEQIFNGLLPVGIHNVPVTAPIGSVIGTTFARCRISRQGGLTPKGLASDGEVEDYTVDIEENPAVKWVQLPDMSPNGIDVKVTGQWLADDFECTSYGPITDVHLWCSWKYDEVGEITNLHLSFHTDDPCGPGGSDPCNEYSQPDELKWQHDFAPSEITMTPVMSLADGEWWWDPVRGDLIASGDWTIWRLDVNIDPREAFLQEGDPCEPVIYWMDVRVDTSTGELGWKTRRYPEQYMDDAVYHWGELPFLWKELRYPNVHPYEGNSVDMAFVITGEEWERPKEPVPNLKWSQPPIEWDPTDDLPVYCGWDEKSYNREPSVTEAWKIVADDFRCLGTMPVDSVHWWGSYFDWEWSWGHGLMPDDLPIAWKIGFWSNVPAGMVTDYSYPELLLWQIDVDASRVKVEEVGMDDYGGRYPYDVCYQFYVDLEPNEVFWQNEYLDMTMDDIFWLSIVAVYPGEPCEPPYYPWGWKTRPWPWMDDAVTFSLADKPEPGMVLEPTVVQPLIDPEFGESVDVSFELDTDPCYIKWEQPYTGIRHWPHYEDEESVAVEDASGLLTVERMVADDWPCEANLPVMAVAWWGSYIGYRYEACTGPALLPPRPDYFLLSIWDDVPADTGDPLSFSHPNNAVWTYSVSDYDEVLVGYDKHPEDVMGPPREPVFRYSVALPEEAWFCQEEGSNIYWLSVVAVYHDFVPDYPWGWTNHKHVYMDDAVAGTVGPGGGWIWQELHDQTGISEDMSFQLYTEPDCYDSSDPKYNQWVLQGKPKAWCCPYHKNGDMNGDGFININDVLLIRPPNFNRTYPEPLYDCRCDIDHNGFVNINDLLPIRPPNFNITLPAPCRNTWRGDCGPHKCTPAWP